MITPLLGTSFIGYSRSTGTEACGNAVQPGTGTIAGARLSVRHARGSGARHGSRLRRISASTRIYQEKPARIPAGHRHGDRRRRRRHRRARPVGNRPARSPPPRRDRRAPPASSACSPTRSKKARGSMPASTAPIPIASRSRRWICARCSVRSVPSPCSAPAISRSPTPSPVATPPRRWPPVARSSSSPTHPIPASRKSSPPP